MARLCLYSELPCVLRPIIWSFMRLIVLIMSLAACCNCFIRFCDEQIASQIGLIVRYRQQKHQEINRARIDLYDLVNRLFLPLSPCCPFSKNKYKVPDAFLIRLGQQKCQLSNFLKLSQWSPLAKMISNFIFKIIQAAFSLP